MDKIRNRSVFVVVIALGIVAKCFSDPILSPAVKYKIRSFPPTRNVTLTHMTVHKASGDIYLGGLNSLHHLNRDFVQTSFANLNSSGETNNKILAVASDIARLITCGSYNRACQLRNLVNISNVVDRLDDMISPGEYSSVGVVVQGVNNENVDFYIAQSILESTRTSSRSICIHSVTQSSFTRCKSERSTSAFRTEPLSLGFEIKYTSSLVYKNFTYFVASQRSGSDKKSSIVPKMSRICHQQSQNLETFTELELKCLSGEISYTIIKAAEVVDDQLFAVFVKNNPPDDIDFNPVSESTLCIYNMTNLVLAFEEAVNDCACSDDGANINYLSSAGCRLLQSLNCEDSVPDRGILNCQNDLGQDVYRYPASTAPFSAAAVIKDDSSSFSSVQVFTIDGKRGAFIGTQEGKLLKIYLDEDGSAQVYEEITLNSPLQSNSWIKEAEESILVLTANELMELKIVDCSQYQTCDDCIRPSEAGAGDPFCGWCTLQNMCTQYSKCPMANSLTRWLPYTETQCVAIDKILPSNQQAIEDPVHQINLTVIQLPELARDEFYSCKFGNGLTTKANVSGNVVSCNTPPIRDLVSSINTEAFRRVDLHIFSSETEINFVTTDFFFYDCSQIKSCTGCVMSRWACDWCIYDHRCTHDSSECQTGDTIVYGENNPSNPDTTNNTISSDHCPQVVPSDTKIYVPVEVEKTLTFTAKNIPTFDGTKVTYECVLTTKTGQEIKRMQTVLVKHTGSNMTNITCERGQYSYVESVQEKERLVTLVWDGDKKVDGNQPITLYKCAVDRPDCSRCLSQITSLPILQCGWCGDICVVHDDSDCRNSWVQQGGMCGPPNIDSILPETGPIEGGTVVTIAGSNLGQDFRDVSSIIVAGVPCSTEGLENMYKVGERVSCETGRSDSAKSGVISVTVNREQGSSQDMFSYQDPKITSINPTRGPKAGGTMMTITGSKLITGGERNAIIGGNRCDIVSSTETDTSFDCITSSGTKGEATVVVSFDGAERKSPINFTYTANPNVTDINPKATIKAGGNFIQVEGFHLDVVKEPRMLATIGGRLSTGDVCQNITKTSMRCKSPRDRSPDRRRRQNSDNIAEASIGFMMDGVEDLRTWSEMNDVTFLYVPNPEYFPFEDPYVYSGSGLLSGVLSIKGKNLNLGSTSEDVTVFIGTEDCKIRSLDVSDLFCELPLKSPKPTDHNGKRTKSNLPEVTVLHGNLVFPIGSIIYQEESIIQYILIGLIILIVLICLLFFLLFCKLTSGAKKERKEMERIMFENSENTRGELKTLYTLQQTAMDNFSTQVEDQPNLPIVSEDEYISNMLFLGLRVQPEKTPPHDPEDKIHGAMNEFSKLLNNRDFLKVFITTLDKESSLPMMDRVNIASLITLSLVLEGKLDYYTEVMTSLMKLQIEDSVDANRPKQLYRWIENIVEKMVSNWVSLCMYSYLKTHAAESLYQLFGGIKCVCEKGPIDAVTGKSQFSLSDEHMLDTLIPFEEITLQVLANEEDGEKISISVLNVDTITQVKNKIIDYLFRGWPYSQRPRGTSKDLEWRQGINGQLILRDEYHISRPDEHGWKKLNTLADYKLTSGCLVALVEKQARPNAQLTSKFDQPQKESNAADNYESYEMHPPLLRTQTLIEAKAEEGTQLYHLTQEQESNEVEVEEGGCCGCFNSREKSKQQYRRIREVVLPLMPLTRDAIQKSVDKAFDAMLSRQEIPPLVKHLFDFFDHQAGQHNIDVRDDVVKAWKNNVLPLRFWTTILANPTYIFDVRCSRYVEACLRVLVKMMRDACSKINFEYNKDIYLSRILYAKLLPVYSEKVMQYYTSVQDLPRVNPDVLSTEFRNVCQAFQDTFNPVSTLYQLFEFVSPYHDVLIAALEEDAACHTANLAYRLQEVCASIKE